jgi:hypothetical protein
LKVRSRSLRLGWGKTPRTPPDLLLQIPRGKKVPGRIRPLQAGSREDNLATRADTGPFTLWTRLMR